MYEFNIESGSPIGYVKGGGGDFDNEVVFLDKADKGKGK